MVKRATDDEESRGLNREELLQLAIQTSKQNPQGARVMFQQVLAQDPRNERALLWMAALSKKKGERRQYLQRVLKINPRNKAAREELERIARMEQARARRTLFFGVLAIVIVVLVVVAAVLLLIAVA